MTEQEAGALASDAIRALRQAANAGAFLRYEGRFRERLANALAKPDLAHLDREALQWLFADQPDRPGLSRDRSGEATPDLSGLSIGDILDRWSKLASELEVGFDNLDAARPIEAAMRTPLAFSAYLGEDEDVRGQEVADLWRTYLTASTPEAGGRALTDLKAFFAADARLIEQWHLQQRAAEAPMRARVRELVETGTPVLERLREVCGEPGDWPMLAGLRASLCADADAQRDRLAARLGVVDGAAP